MSQNLYVIMVTFLLFIIIFLTRALPFFMGKMILKNEQLKSICMQLPAYIIFLLVIYEINPGTFIQYPYGIPEVIALTLVIFIQWWRRTAILSIAVGTLSYLLLMNLPLSIAVN